MLYRVSFTFRDAMHVFNVPPSVRYATLRSTLSVVLIQSRQAKSCPVARALVRSVPEEVGERKVRGVVVARKHHPTRHRHHNHMPPFRPQSKKETSKHTQHQSIPPLSPVYKSAPPLSRNTPLKKPKTFSAQASLAFFRPNTSRTSPTGALSFSNGSWTKWAAPLYMLGACADCTRRYSGGERPRIVQRPVFVRMSGRYTIAGV